VFLTRRRIAEHAQFAAVVPFLAALIVVRRPIWTPFIIIAAAGLSVMVRPLVMRYLRTAAPEHVQRRLPYGPLDLAETDGPPHSYADLIAIWRDPAFHCGHVPDLSVPRIASPALTLLPASILYLLSAVAIASTFFLAHKIAAVLTVLPQAGVAVLWQRTLRRQGVDVPSATDIWVTSAVAMVMGLIGVVVLAARSG
jgi:hypothetical protein